MNKKPRKFLWLRMIGYMFLPLFLAPIFFSLTYPLKPHCSLGQGPHGCTPLCEATSYFENGQPSNYKITPCYHYENPTVLQRFTYEKSDIFYPILLVVIVSLFFWLTYINKVEIITKIAFAPIYFIKENRRNKSFIARAIIFIILIIPLLFEWVVGYIIFLGTLFNQVNLF